MRTHGQELEKSSISAISLISSKIGFVRALQLLHHYITVPHITSHANIHTFVFNIWQDTDNPRTQYLNVTIQLSVHRIMQFQNKETRSTPFKEESLPKNLVKLGGLLLQEKITLEVLILNRTHFMSRACFHQIIHLINSNLRFRTRLSLFIWSNPIYVSALGYLWRLIKSQPMFQHWVILFQFFSRL